MAIIVEEEKRKATGLLRIAGWIVILAILAAAIYYIFFVTPEALPLSSSSADNNFSSLSKVSIASGTVESQAFLSLEQHVQSPTPQGPGGISRPNPFLAP